MSNVPSTTTQINDDFFPDTIGPDSFKPPRVVLGQKTSDGKEPGLFNFPSGNAVEEINGCILVKASQSRVMYRGRNQPSICASDNFWRPSPRIKDPLSHDCRTCVYQDWDNQDQKRELADKYSLSITNFRRPLCKQSYDFILADSNRVPFVISFQGAARAVVEKNLMSVIKMWDSSIPKCAIQFDLKVQPMSNDKGSYYLPQFSNFAAAADPDACVSLYQMFHQRAAEMFANEYAERDEENRMKDVGDDDIPF